MAELLTKEQLAEIEKRAPYWQNARDGHVSLTVAERDSLVTHCRALEAERDDAIDFIQRRGYRRCDIPACNCGSWHGGLAEERLREIGDELGSETQGITIIDAVRKRGTERDDLLNRSHQTIFFPCGCVFKQDGLDAKAALHDAGHVKESVEAFRLRAIEAVQDKRNDWNREKRQPDVEDGSHMEGHLHGREVAADRIITLLQSLPAISEQKENSGG